MEVIQYPDTLLQRPDGGIFNGLEKGLDAPDILTLGKVMLNCGCQNGNHGAEKDGLKGQATGDAVPVQRQQGQLQCSKGDSKERARRVLAGQVDGQALFG